MANFNFKVSVDGIANLVTKLSTLATADNAVQFSVGFKDNGKGLFSQAVIANGGQQLTVGFVTDGVPAGYESGNALRFAVRAKQLCDYLNQLLSLESDFSFALKEEKALVITAGSTAKVSLPLVSEAVAQIADDSKSAHTMAEVKTADLLSVLKRGGYAAKKEADELRRLDRVVLQFAKGVAECLSTDGFRIVQAKKESKCAFNEQMLALSFFKPDERAGYVQKVQSGELSEADFFAAAKKNGYVPSIAKLALSSEAVGTLLKVLAGGVEQTSIKVTAQKLHVTCGNVKLLLVLAGEVPGAAASAVAQFDKIGWERIAVDRGALCNALNIVGLSCTDGVKTPVRLFVKKGYLLVADDSGNNQVKVATVEGSSEVAVGMEAPMNLSYFSTAVSKFGGNVVLGFTDSQNQPLLVSDGSVTGDAVTAKAFILKVKLAVPDEAEPAEPKKGTPKKEKAPAKAEPADEEEASVPTEAFSNLEEEAVDM